MSTRGRMSPREFLSDDPGPWSIAAPVFHTKGRPDRRRAVPPAGLVLSPPPQIGLDLAGIDPAATVAGAGRIEVFAGIRESARALTFIEGDSKLEAIGPLVKRVWTLDSLAYPEEIRPEQDPAADIAGPVTLDALSGELPDTMVSPDGSLVAVPVRAEGAITLAIFRAEDRAVVRWIRGCLSAAWSSDGQMIAIGGDWGGIIARHITQ